jgi:hypothetical protein
MLPLSTLLETTSFKPPWECPHDCIYRWEITKGCSRRPNCTDGDCEYGQRRYREFSPEGSTK